MNVIHVAVLLFYCIVVVSGSLRQNLDYPQFLVGKTHVFNFTMTTTAAIPGMRPQVAKSVLQAEVRIYAKTQQQLIIAMQKVLVSGSQSSVGSDADTLNLHPDKDLENLLQVPIQCIYENGEVKSYTLDPKESLESQKIKRTVLRNLEVYLDPKILQPGKEEDFPIAYNVTKSSPAGNYSAHYLIISSPYDEFSRAKHVFNITRMDNYEVVSYPAYKTVSNFMKAGCPVVCRKNNIENAFDSGCPVGYEPHQKPMKKAFVQKYNLKITKDGSVVIDSVATTETHVADVYDQNMEVNIRSTFTLKEETEEKIKERKDQKEFKNLDDFSNEINETEINNLCDPPNATKALLVAKDILQQLSETVGQSDLEKAQSKQVGENLLLLRKALTALNQGDLRNIQEWIGRYDKLYEAKETEKIRRQIWLDMLPLIGTPESISFITQIIRENMNRPSKVISLWEASSILMSLPDNILHVDEKTITELAKLIDLIENRQEPGYTIFYSASHVTLAQTISKFCAAQRNEQGSTQPRRRSNGVAENLIQSRLSSTRNDDGTSHFMCNSKIVDSFVDTVIEGLNHNTSDKSKKVIYIETLSRIGQREVLPYMEPFVYGKMSSFTPNYADFLKVATIKALHNMVHLYPDEIHRLMKPVFFNESESFKVRIAAFSVLIRCEPSLGLLQQLADLSWRERSVEVGSYVTSTLETYGNSSLPCHQLLSHRIKKALPQFKRFDNGYHHSKNLMWSIFDDIRGFGLAKFLQYSASNESFIPSSIYGALEYNVDSLRDYLFQYSATIEGVRGSEVYDQILSYFGIKTSEYIPKGKEPHIFPGVKVVDREPETWKITFYHKLFYSVSFNYFDADEIESVLNVVKDYLHHYLRTDATGNIEGHLVKVYMPSAYRTEAVGHAFPSRVQFEMENPLLLSVKFKLKQEKVKTSRVYTLSVEPSIHSSAFYTNHILNLNDCKNVGVYHESRTAATFSFEIILAVETLRNFNVSYKFSRLPQKILTYHSEAGTYAGCGNLTTLPFMEQRTPILTVPAAFKRERKWSVPFLPPFSVSVLTEDLMEEKEKIPQDFKEALIFMITKYRNSGWRSKSLEIRRIPGDNLWSENTQVSVGIEYERQYKPFSSYQETSIEKLIRALDINYFANNGNLKTFRKEGLILYNAIDEDEAQILDTALLRVTQTEKDRTLHSANVKMIYKHTFNRVMHAFRAEFSSKTYEMTKPVVGSADLVAIFLGAPDLFRYNDESYGNLNGIIVAGITFGPGDWFENLNLAAKGLLRYASTNETLFYELSAPVDVDNFLPNTHNECLNDMKHWKSLSVSCLKAFRERAIYNQISVEIDSQKQKSKTHENVMGFLDSALKRIFEDDIEVITREAPDNGSFVNITAMYIDKLTDNPVYQVFIRKPKETIKFRTQMFDFLPTLSAFERVFDTYLLKVTNNSYPATCALMQRYISTFDMQSYRLPDDVPVCNYVLSTHCVKEKKFAVMASVNAEFGHTREVRMYIGNDSIVLTQLPIVEHHFNLNFNGKDYIISPLLPAILMDGDLIAAYLQDSNKIDTSIVELDARAVGVKIIYNGVRVLVRVSPRYKGELCGLCGDFNGDVLKEFRGIDGCLYSDAGDFAKTYVTGTCTDKSPFKPYICGNKEIVPSAREHKLKPESHIDDKKQINTASMGSTKGSRRIIKRTIVISHEDNFCFSLNPQPVCEDGLEPLESESEDVEFTCLPKNDPTSRNRVKEAKIRILKELKNESCDFTKTMTIARSC